MSARRTKSGKNGRGNASRKVAREKVRRAEREAALRGTSLAEVRTNAAGRSAYVFADGSQTIELGAGTAVELAEYQRWARGEFLRRWGRPMRGDDLLFPDWDAAEPNTPMSAASMEAQMVSVMEEVGIDPAHIYAFQVTGRIVTEENIDLLSDEDRQEWYDAVDRYTRLHR